MSLKSISLKILSMCAFSEVSCWMLEWSFPWAECFLEDWEGCWASVTGRKPWFNSLSSSWETRDAILTCYLEMEAAALHLGWPAHHPWVLGPVFWCLQRGGCQPNVLSVHALITPTHGEQPACSVQPGQGSPPGQFTLGQLIESRAAASPAAS